MIRKAKLLKIAKLITMNNNYCKPKHLLRSFIDRDESFCTICLNSIDDLENSLNISDKVIFKSENEKSFVEILNIILTPDVTGDFITPYVCRQCANSALSSYLFLKMVKENSEYLRNIVKNVTNVLKSTVEDNLEHVKTIYLLNEDSKFHSFYDTKCEINTLEAAKLRLETITSEENIISITLEPEGIGNELLQLRKKKSTRNTLVNMCERDKEKIKCKLCLKLFSAMEYFNSHYYRHHAPKTVKCPKCPRVFGSTTILNQHRLECHLDAICTECGKAFNNCRYLKMHELSHRTSFPCEVCNRVYKSKETYNQHIKLKICSQKQRKGQSEASFTCDICNKKFCRKGSLKVHISFKHESGKAYVCEWCNKKFSSQSHLNAHILKHTQIKSFSCAICNGKFGTKQGLIVHTRYHTGEKPYKCLECEATFITSTQRSAHVRRYHNDFQFECEVCCSKFKSEISLRNHKKKVKYHGKLHANIERT